MSKKDYVKLSKEWFDKQAPVYDEKDVILYSKYGKISCQNICDYLKDKEYKNLLDIGCGTGYLIDMLSKNHKAEYTGLDLSPEMIKKANKKKIKNATFIEGISDDLPFGDKSFDIVTCSQSFHHYPKTDKPLKEALRVLKPGGLYIISDTGVGPFKNFGVKFDNFVYRHFSKSGDCNVSCLEKMEKDMKYNGFNIVYSKKITAFIYFILLLEKREKKMSKYIGIQMIKKSRMINYFNTLDISIQSEVINRIDELVKEEKKYCDKGNYEHMCNLLSLLSIYEVLQNNGKSEEEAYNIVKKEMHRFIQPSKEKFQKLSKKKCFWPIIKKIVPLGFKKKSGYGWRYTWHNDTPKNEFRFETNECIYAKIFKKRKLIKLGPLFCQCDVINYGELHNIDFKRTKTLCYGDDECNFIFIKHDNDNFMRTKAK